MFSSSSPAWVSIIGVGYQGLSSLSRPIYDLIVQSKVIIGNAEHSDFFKKRGLHCLTWPRPMSRIEEILQAYRGQAVCLLTQGDPYIYGIAPLIASYVRSDEIAVYPSVSLFSLAAAHLGWSFHQSQWISLLHQDASALNSYLKPLHKILLQVDEGQIDDILGNLKALGYGNTSVYGLSYLGQDQESCVALNLGDKIPLGLQILALDLMVDEDFIPISSVAGIDVSVLPHSVALPQAWRAAIISLLKPFDGHSLWDLSDQDGFMALEWLHSGLRLQSLVFMEDETQENKLQEQAKALGFPFLEIIHDFNLDSINDMNPVDALIIGGKYLPHAENLWHKLKNRGRLVLLGHSAPEQRLILEFQADKGGEVMTWNLHNLGQGHPQSIMIYSQHKIKALPLKKINKISSESHSLPSSKVKEDDWDDEGYLSL